MRRQNHPRKMLILAGFIIIGLVYVLLINLHVAFTGTHQLDGIIGVMLGLYACSHPAANVLDMLFYARGANLHGLSKQGYVLWWGLNLLVFLVGWYVIFTGLMRFTAAR